MRLRTDLSTYQIGLGFDALNPPGDHKVRWAEHPMCRCVIGPFTMVPQPDRHYSNTARKKTKMKKLLFGASAEVVVPHMPRPARMPKGDSFPDFITLRPFSSHSDTEPGDQLEVVCRDGRGEVIGYATVRRVIRAPLMELCSSFSRMEPEIRAKGFSPSLKSEHLRMEHLAILAKYYPRSMLAPGADWVALCCQFEPAKTEMDKLLDEWRALVDSFKDAQLAYVAEVVLPQAGFSSVLMGDPPYHWFRVRTIEQARSAVAAVRRYKQSL